MNGRLVFQGEREKRRPLMSSMGPLSGAAGPRGAMDGLDRHRHHAAAVQMHTQRDHMHPVLNNKFRGKIMLSLYSLTPSHVAAFPTFSASPPSPNRKRWLAGKSWPAQFISYIISSVSHREIAWRSFSDNAAAVEPPTANHLFPASSTAQPPCSRNSTRP
jgi:hypothetical protein